MSAIHSRSASSCSGSSISMPLLEKEVDVKAPDDEERPSENPEQSEEYQFRLQLMNDSITSSCPSLNSLGNVDDSPPPISPNSTAFDPIMRQGQVKIIRTGDTMHVMTLEDGRTPSITSYSKPLNPPWRPTSPRPRLDLSPLRSNFQFEGESAIQTISRYSFPNLNDSELENLTLQEILTAAQQIVSKWTAAAATTESDCGLTEEQRTFLTDRFLTAKLETVVLKDWEMVREIFSSHHEWKLEQLMYEEPSPVVAEVNFKRSACLKSLPRVKPAKKRKEMLKEYDAFVDLGQKVDLRGLKRKRGVSSSTFILSLDKIESLLDKSQYYGKAFASTKGRQKQKAIRSSRIFKTVKNSVKVTQPDKLNSSSAVDKLNPRRDKPMAKIRSQVRKVDRLARLNGESFHEAALTLSKNSGLDSPKQLSSEGEPLPASSQGPSSSSQEPPQGTTGTTTETDLDLGLGGVCFDADVAELTNSVMDGNVLEDLDNLVQNPGFNSTGNEPGNSMLKALHAGIGEEEFVEQFGVPDIVTSMEDDGLLDLAITPTLDADYDDVSSLMQPSPSTSKGDGEIFLMTGLSAAEHSAFDSLGQDLATADKPKSQKAPQVKSAAAALAEARKTVEGSGSSANPVSDVTDAKVLEEENQKIVRKSNQEDNNVSNRRIKIERRRARRSAPAEMLAHEASKNPEEKVSAKKAQALLNCTLTGSYWQIPENKFPCNRPKRANAGALMTTKSRGRNRDRDTDKDKDTSEPNKGSEKSSPTEPKKRAARTAVRSNSKVWHKKFISDGYNSPITPDGMVVTKKTALRCIVSIPDSICPTSHDEFLIKHRRYFGEEEIREVQELIGKARPKMEASNKKSGMDKYLKKLATRSKQGAVVTPEADSTVIKTEEVAAGNDVKTNEESNKEKSAASVAASSVAAVAAVAPVPPPAAPAKPAVVPTVPKPKAYSARSKRFEEDEKAVIVKLDGNQILADGNLFVNINHENYVREKDVEIPYDDHEFLSSTNNVEKIVEVATEKKTEGEKGEKEGQQQQKRQEDGQQQKLEAEQQQKLEAEQQQKLEEGQQQKLEEGQQQKQEEEGQQQKQEEEGHQQKQEEEGQQQKQEEGQQQKQQEGQQQKQQEVVKEPDTVKNVCDTRRKLPHCVLGCVCGSIHPGDKGAGEREQGKHCGKVKCMLECNCNSNNWNNEDADIRSRLRPRVSMLNWNTRLNLNYLDTYISPDKDKDFSSSKGDHRSVFSGHRLKRNIIAPKRNTDFISHNASKRLEAGRPLTRQATKMSPFSKNIGSRLQRMKQRQQLLRPRHGNDERLLRLKKSITGDSGKQSDKADGRSKSGAISRQRGGYSDALSKTKKKLVPGVDYSLEGTGPMIPPELMARFAPFMEIRYCPKPDKYLPLQSESEEDSTDDEDVEEYASLANLSYNFNQIASTSKSKPEESFAAPVIVSYRSCQDGRSDVMYPTPSTVS